MKKSKRNEVPKDYRKDYKKEFIKLLQMFAICFGLILFGAIIIFVN